MEKSPKLHLEERLLDLLGRIEIVPRRMLLDTGDIHATVPMLRGVWGRALRHLDIDVYKHVFEGRRTTGRDGVERTPLYLLRPAPADPAFAPALDWTLIGNACGVEEVLTRAWDMASGMGLGPDRKPFAIRQVRWLDIGSAMTSREQRWSLREAAEAMHGTLPDGGAIRLRFDAPLRLLRRGKLIENPTFTDIAVAALRRLCLLDDGNVDAEFSTAVVDAAGPVTSSAWHGQRNDFVRWSGTQQREVDLHGVTGSLELPEGAGNLWPLLVVGAWLHLGKGTVFGLGGFETAFSDRHPSGR